MTYDEALRWLLTLPDFERTGEFAERPDVGPMLALLSELGDPHRGRRATLHIAGSKGKGSTGAMVEGVLRAAGLRTGHYISPHLHRYNERIRIDGQPIAPDGFAASMDAARPAMETVQARFPGRQLLAFDALTAAGFVAFREAEVQAQVVEVGLGGLLDSTNVFHDGGDDVPHVVVLTPISLEHTAILGDTIAQIAGQKAGVITAGCVAIAAPQRESALDVFAATAAERGAALIETAKVCQLERKSANAEGQEFRLKTPRATYAARLPLAGRHQLDNAATAVLACEELCARGGVELTEVHVRAGLGSVAWPGRLETLKRRPWVIIDGAHNGDSAKRMVAALRDDVGLRSAVLLVGTLGGKDVAAMAQATAGFADAVIAPAWPSARAMDTRDVAAAFRAGGEAPVTTYGSLLDGYEAAVAQAGDRGAVVAFGSLAFAAAVRELVLGIESDVLRLAVAGR